MERLSFTSKQSLKRKSVTCSPRSQGLSPRAMVSTLWTRLRCDDNRLACRCIQTHTQKSVSFSQHVYNLFSKLINYKWLVCRILFNQSARLMNMLYFLSLSLQACILRFLWVLFLDQTQCPCRFSSHELQKPNWSRKSTPVWGRSLVWQPRLYTQLFWGESDRRQHELTHSDRFSGERKFQTAWLHLPPQNKKQQPTIQLHTLLLK